MRNKKQIKENENFVSLINGKKPHLVADNQMFLINQKNCSLMIRKF
jgi:hypothetical protein